MKLSFSDIANSEAYQVEASITAKANDKVARRIEKVASDFANFQQANTAIDEALRRGAAVTSMGSSLFTQQAVGVPQRPVGQQTFVHPVVPGGQVSEPTVRVEEKPSVTSRSE